MKQIKFQVVSLLRMHGAAFTPRMFSSKIFISENNGLHITALLAWTGRFCEHVNSHRHFVIEPFVASEPNSDHRRKIMKSCTHICGLPIISIENL